MENNANWSRYTETDRRESGNQDALYALVQGQLPEQNTNRTGTKIDNKQDPMKLKSFCREMDTINRTNGSPQNEKTSLPKFHI